MSWVPAVRVAGCRSRGVPESRGAGVAVLGPLHPDTLTTRNNIAFWTGRLEEAAEALRLFRELLPDRERVLGPLHPDTQALRALIAAKEEEGGTESV